ncbi:hypothetical protein DLJ49_00545 [Rhodovulum sp. 12E13]|uniref:hypothetical protein n=1 Tax=Rhodovulum sp. 12E13 TaxID=2203891 RepID=UPI000E12C8A1|nr:hypothetical protein [Rhodovulum sp. 12E13]RDC75278.1 hypothetical protein DLJ49_00545 [Rhodovulum sp. 12E13]
MVPQAALIALASAALFGALALMSDRKRGAFLAQIALFVAGALLFVAIVVPGPVFGIAPAGLAAFAVGLISAAGAGMLYHLYLGRFERVWAARGVFTAVYLGLSALFGLVFLSLL